MPTHNHPGSFAIRFNHMLVGTIVGLLVLGASACGVLDSLAGKFAVGDCVRIERHLLDHDLSSADCDGAVGTFDIEERVFRVNSIIDGTKGSCPEGAGFFPVEFTHEPHGVIYCLVQES